MKAKKGSYTPTTREVRRFYISESDPYEWGPYFDCWLEDIKAEAWDEGAGSTRDIHGDVIEPNPYRKETEND